jgi:hypothetical protein
MGLQYVVSDVAAAKRTPEDGQARHKNVTAAKWSVLIVAVAQPAYNS